MQRHGSKRSITSITSTCRTSGKRILPTHVIIQRENSNQVIVLPVTHLVNSSSTGIKLNQMATFKNDLNSRKQERGRIIQLGNKEECMEQLQVFEMVTDIDKQSTNHDENDLINDDQQNNHDQEKAKKTPENMSSDSENESIVITSKQSSYNNQSSKKYVSISSTTTGIQKEKINRNTNFNVENDDHSQIVSESQIIIYPDSQNNKNKNEIECEQQKTLQDLSDTDLLNRYEDLSKKCNDLAKENAKLQLEYDRLLKENRILKKTTIPIPDTSVRLWIINMAKYFTSKTPDTDISKYANALNIANLQDLVACVQDTTSNTARQVVRYLYTETQLLTMTGPEIPASQRQAIRDFAESQRGPISDHKFNEAVNGVFRAKKNELKAKEKKKLSIETRNTDQIKEQTQSLNKKQYSFDHKINNKKDMLFSRSLNNESDNTEEQY